MLKIVKSRKILTAVRPWNAAFIFVRNFSLRILSQESSLFDHLRRAVLTSITYIQESLYYKFIV
jgi:hypothetical protein